MFQRHFDAAIGVVTTHSRIVLLLALVLTAGMVVGTTHLEMGGEGDGISATVDTTVDHKEEYVREHYGTDTDGEDADARSQVFVRDPGGNALAKDRLIETLRYQRAVLEDETVAATLADPDPDAPGTEGSVRSIASMVAIEATDNPSPTIEEQITVLDATDREQVASLVSSTIAEERRAHRLLPDSYEPGTASVESQRLVFEFDATEDGTPPAGAQEVLYETASERGEPQFFTVGEHALEDSQAVFVENTMTLIVPVVLGLILGIAALTYRDPIDVTVGVVGVLVSIVWMFGLLGWAGIDVGTAAVIGPVLVAGLSIDYGFHVFMRYREERGEAEPIRPPMHRGVRSVSLPLALVTITAAIGFLANLANPVGMIRSLGIAITVGVVAAFVVFLTLVPALKVTIDDALERLGLARRRQPLGHGAYLQPLLGGCILLARRGAPIVLAVAIVLAAGGGLAWTALDQASVQQQTDPAADWKQDLPGPMAWEENGLIRQQTYVAEDFRTVEDGKRIQVLIEGDVMSDGTLEAVRAGTRDAERRGIIPDGRTDRVKSPVTVIRSVAERDATFAATVAAADTDGDGVPDRNVEAVYEHLFAVAPDAASQVIERTDGTYHSVRILGPPEHADSAAVTGDRADELFALENRVESTDESLTATAISDATGEQAALDAITDGILRVMVLALGTVVGVLVVTFRLVHGSATLGAVTAGPIALVLGFVVGGMYLLDVPLTFLTALLVSLVIGIGIDHTIHVSDRFAQELDRGRGLDDALERAVTGTGGALLGSTLTTVAAFAGLVLHPNPQFESFATLVILALLAAFATSVLVLPSALSLWWQYVAAESITSGRNEPAPA